MASPGVVRNGLKERLGCCFWQRWVREGEEGGSPGAPKPCLPAPVSVPPPPHPHPHSFLEEEAWTRAVSGARDCIHPSSSMAWELLCRCRCGWQGGRLMIPPAHLWPPAGHTLLLLSSPRTCHSWQLPPLLVGDGNTYLRSQRLLGPSIKCSPVLGYGLSQAEGLLIPGMT